jgi:hypothetical protein
MEDKVEQARTGGTVLLAQKLRGCFKEEKG